MLRVKGALDSANGSNSRENDRRVLLLRAGLSRVLLLRVILTGEVTLRVLGLTGAGLFRVLLLPAIRTGEILLRVLGLTAGVLASWVLASWVLAAAAAFVRSLILISDWAHRSTATRHSTIHHIRGRECHIMAVVDGGMS